MMKTLILLVSLTASAGMTVFAILEASIQSLKQELVLELSGFRSVAPAALAKRLKEAEDEFARFGASMTPEEKTRIQAEIEESKTLLSEIEALRSGAANPYFQGFVRALQADRKVDAGAVVGRTVEALKTAAADPTAAARAFDNIKDSLDDSPAAQEQLDLVRQELQWKEIQFSAPRGAASAQPPVPKTNLDASRDALERKIIEHLTGLGRWTFDGLVSELAALKAAAGPEPSPLRERLDQDERLLLRARRLAQGKARLDTRVAWILLAAGKAAPRDPAGAMSEVLRQLQLAADASRPEEAERIFDNLRPRTGPDYAASVFLASLKAETSKILEEKAAVDNCREALNGAPLSVGKLCSHSKVGAAILGGLLDAVHQQFMTAEGILSNLLFMLLGIIFGALTGGVGIIARILFALGMTAWVVFKLIPKIAKALWKLGRSKAESVERYAAVRSLAALGGSIVIMALLALLGGKIGKKLPASVEAKLGGISAKAAGKMPAGMRTMMDKFNASLEAKTAPNLEGEARVAAAPGKPAPTAAVNPAKGYAVAAAERVEAPLKTKESAAPVVEARKPSETAPEAAKPAPAAAAAHKAAVEHIEANIKPGEAVTPAKARAVVAGALEKAREAAKKEGAEKPVDVAISVVAKKPSGGRVLISAAEGEGAVLVRRGGEIVEPKGAETELNGEDVVLAADREAAVRAREGRPEPVESEPRAEAELRVPAKPSRWVRIAAALAGREGRYAANVLYSLAGHFREPDAFRPIKIDEPQAQARPADPGPPTPVIARTQEDPPSLEPIPGRPDSRNEGAPSAAPIAAEPKVKRESRERSAVSRHSAASGPFPAAASGGGGPSAAGGAGGGSSSGGGAAGGGTPASAATPPPSPQAPKIESAPAVQEEGPIAAERPVARPPAIPERGGSAALPPSAAALSSSRTPSPRSMASRFDGSPERRAPLEARRPPSPPADAGTRLADQSSSVPETRRGFTKPSARASRSEASARLRVGERIAASPSVPPASQEDYGYTYLQPAFEAREFDHERDLSKEPWFRFWLSVVVRASAAAAAGYLALQSDLPYLLGLARRRRSCKPA